MAIDAFDLNRLGWDIAEQAVRPLREAIADGVVLGVEGNKARVRFTNDTGVPGFTIPPAMLVEIDDHVLCYRLGGYQMILTNLTRGGWVAEPPVPPPTPEPDVDPSEYNVLKYGVRAETGIDDTDAIHALANDHPGRRLIFPGNRTYWTRGLNITSAVDFVLEPGAVIKLIPGGPGPVVLLAAAVTVTGGTIDGIGASVATRCLSIHTADVLIDNVKLTGAWTGLYGTDCSRLTVRDCSMISCVGSIYIAAVSSQIDRVRITGNEIERGAGDNQSGIFVTGDTYAVKDISIEGNGVLHPHVPDSDGYICIEIFGTVDGASIAGNTLRGGGMGVSLAHDCSDIAVTGNTIRGAGSWGIELASGTGLTVTGNTIDGARLMDAVPETNWGIILGNGAPGSVVSGNNIRRCTSRGIDLRGASNVINGNVISQAAGICYYVDGGAGTAVSGNTAIPTGTATGSGAGTPGAGIVYSGNVGF